MGFSLRKIPRSSAYTISKKAIRFRYPDYNPDRAEKLRPVYSDTTQLNSTRQREQQLTQFVGRDVINKNTTDLAVRFVRYSAGSVELS